MLITKFNGVANDSGNCTFENKEDAAKVREKLQELRNVAVEFEMDKVNIKAEDNIKLTIKDIEDISDFVEISE